MSNTNSEKIVHLISLNAQGLRSSLKRARLKEWIFQQKATIVFLQETHFTTEIEYLVKKDFELFDVYNSYGDNASRGCATLISKSLNANMIDINTDENGRYIFINLELENTIYSLLNIYAPNDQRMRNLFFNSIDKLLKECSLGLKLIAGDYNQALAKIDRVTKNIT